MRDGGELRPITWERALETAASSTNRKRLNIGHLMTVACNEARFLLGHLVLKELNSRDLDSRGGAGVDAGLMRVLSAPALQASVPDLEFAARCCSLTASPWTTPRSSTCGSRKGVRRNGVKLAIVSARPSALDPNAAQILRHTPGAQDDVLRGLEAALRTGEERRVVSRRSGRWPICFDGGEDIVIVWSRRIGEAMARALYRIAGKRLARPGRSRRCRVARDPTDREPTPRRPGMREAGLLPDAGPGLEVLDEAGRGATEIARATAAGELTALYLLPVDPVRDQPDRALWERALHGAALDVAHASVLTEGLSKHATVIFPAESHAEKVRSLHPRRRPAAQPGRHRPARRGRARLGSDRRGPLGDRAYP